MSKVTMSVQSYIDSIKKAPLIEAVANNHRFDEDVDEDPFEVALSKVQSDYFTAFVKEVGVTVVYDRILEAKSIEDLVALINRGLSELSYGYLLSKLNVQSDNFHSLTCVTTYMSWEACMFLLKSCHGYAPEYIHRYMLDIGWKMIDREKTDEEHAHAREMAKRICACWPENFSDAEDEDDE